MRSRGDVLKVWKGLIPASGERALFYRRRKMKAVAAQASPAPSLPSAMSWVEIAPTGESDRGRRLQGKPGFSQCREVREDPGEGRTREVCLLTREAQEEGLQEAGVGGLRGDMEDREVERRNWVWEEQRDFSSETQDHKAKR